MPMIRRAVVALVFPAILAAGLLGWGILELARRDTEAPSSARPSAITSAEPAVRTSREWWTWSDDGTRSTASSRPPQLGLGDPRLGRGWAGARDLDERPGRAAEARPTSDLGE